jgi:hypothetical protein
MPYKDPEARRARQREYQRAYRIKNFERDRARKLELKKNKPTKIVASRQEKAAKQKARRKRYATNPDYREKARFRANRWYAQRRALALGRPKPDICDACGGNDGGIVYDHCHRRGHPRGWLCNNCNKSLGLLRDDPVRLLKLIAYLERTKVNHAPQLTLPGV